MPLKFGSVASDLRTGIRHTMHTLDWIVTKIGRRIGRVLVPIVWVLSHPVAFGVYAGIILGWAGTFYGPDLYKEWAPWMPNPTATSDHSWVGMPVVAKDGTNVGKVHSVQLPNLRWGDKRTAPPVSIYVKEWRGGVYPLTRHLSAQSGAYKHNPKEQRIELSQNADAHRSRPTESWRPNWVSEKYWPGKNYWPGNWDMNWTWPDKWPWT